MGSETGYAGARLPDTTGLRESLHEFDNDDILGQVKIPVLITSAQKNKLGDRVKLVYHKLVNCDKKRFMVFRDEDGASGHCQTGARMLFSEQVFAWLDETLFEPQLRK